MIIHIPFKYEARVHKKRFKEPSNETFFEWLEVDIPEFDDLEAPVAVQWQDETPQELTSMSQREKWGAAPSDKLCQTRWFNNDHWWPSLQRETSSDNYKTFQAQRITADDLRQMCRNGSEIANPLLVRNSYHRDMVNDDEFKGKPLIPSDFKEVFSSTRESALAELQKRINDIIIVDDQVWVRGRQPIIYIKTHYIPDDQPGNLIGLLKIVPEGDPSITNINHTFSLNQFEEASRVALEHAYENQDDVNARVNVTVFIGESIKNDAEMNALIIAAKKVDTEFGNYFAEYDYRLWTNLPPDTGIAFFEFKRALTALDGSNDKFEALVEAADKFQPLCEVAYEHCGRILRHALERWHTKPIELNF